MWSQFSDIPFIMNHMSPHVSRSPSPAPVPSPSHLNKSPLEVDVALDPKESYNMSTLTRINMLTSVSKQTLCLSNKSKSSLESLLQTSQSTRNIRAKVDILQQRLLITSQRLQEARNRLEEQKRCAAATESFIIDRKDDIIEKYENLKEIISKLNEKRSRLDVERSKLTAIRNVLDERRAELMRDVASHIYPIHIPHEPEIRTSSPSTSTPLVTYASIGGFSLPDASSSSPKAQSSFLWGQPSSPTNSQIRKIGKDVSEEEASVAIGYVTHFLLLLSKFTDIPLKYDLDYCGSRSLIIDHLNHETWSHLLGHQNLYSNENGSIFDERTARRDLGVKVTLFVKNKGSKDSRVYFNYGLYLINQIIGQLKWTLSVISRKSGKVDSSQAGSTLNLAISNKRIDLTKTLINLNEMIDAYVNAAIGPCISPNGSESHTHISRSRESLDGVPTPKDDSLQEKQRGEDNYLKREIQAMMRAEDKDVFEANMSDNHNSHHEPNI